ncbi:hypothetical protein G9A89_007334 [Geosiphon pyriformis]|nr:hypothetical protein G9A89_007334 [Geosiphon pyriformis]
MENIAIDERQTLCLITKELNSLSVTFGAPCEVINSQKQSTPEIHKSAIAETLYIVDTDIKHYVTKQFPQVQQPVESDSEEYEYRPNNLTTAQNKSMVNKKPRVLSPTTPSYHQTPQSRIVFNPPLETQLKTP